MHSQQALFSGERQETCFNPSPAEPGYNLTLQTV